MAGTVHCADDQHLFEFNALVRLDRTRKAELIGAKADQQETLMATAASVSSNAAAPERLDGSLEGLLQMPVVR
jgi:hypothetical protein